MGLYAILDEHGKPIAYHENKRIIKEFLSDIGRQNHILVKVKHQKEVEKSSEYLDLYLVKIGKHYIQSIYFDSADILNKEELYSYEEVISLITRELEYNQNISRNERKAMQQTLIFFQERVDEIKDNPCDYESTKRFHDMRMEYQYDINDYENDDF